MIFSLISRYFEILKYNVSCYESRHRYHFVVILEQLRTDDHLNGVGDKNNFISWFGQ